MPFTCVSAAITSSSDIDSSASSGSAPLQDLSREVAEVGALLTAHADGAELLVGQGARATRR